MANYDGVVVSKGSRLDLYNGDTASNTTVKASAGMRISAGGYAYNTTAYNSAVISNAGSAEATYLSGGAMTIFSGGVADGVSVVPNGKLTVSNGGIATGVSISSGGIINASVRGGDSVTRIEGVNESGGFYLSGGTAANFILNSNGQLTVSANAVALDTIIRGNGHLTVSSGGAATGIVQEFAGRLTTYVRGGDTETLVSGTNVSGEFRLSGGVAEDFIVYENAAQYVSSGGTALRTVVSSGWAHQFVSSGAVVESTSVFNKGSMTVYGGGIARDAMIYSGGTMFACGGSISGTTVLGKLLVTTATSGSDESGGVIGGFFDLTIADGGRMEVSESTDFGGTITIAGEALLSQSMTLLDGASLVFDVSGRDSASGVIVNNWAMVTAASGAAYTLSISVGETPKDGSYRLAGNAAKFATPITVNSGAEEIGTLNVGDAITVGGRDYSLALDEDVLTLSIATADVLVKNDLNGDGRADVVMTIAQEGHGAEGATGAWLIQSDQTAAWGDLSQRNEGWSIFGTGITSAGKETNDVYVKSADNVVGAWTTDATGAVTGWVTVGEFDETTNVLGLGDFNGDGQTDLLLRNDNGAVGCFFTSGDVTGWNYFQSLGEEWTVSAVGDLNGDGRDDVVLKHDAGFAGSWLTQDDYTMAWADLDTLPEGFTIVGCGDFNGDGTSDVLLQNGSYYGAWIVENGNAKSWMGLGDLGDVTVEQIADFDGDGIDDLRIRTASGDLGAQLVKGADTLEWKYYGSVGEEWSTSLAAI